MVNFAIAFLLIPGSSLPLNHRDTEINIQCFSDRVAWCSKYSIFSYADIK